MIYYIFSGLIAFMIFFPFNGTISRFFLFGVYIIMCATIFDKAKHNSLIIIAALIGFYYIFPAFNFFKTHSMDDLSEFALGGLNFNFVDYDAHQVLMISKKYTEQFGFLNGKNLLTALFCMIPRSIWSGKLEHSGVLVSEAFKANFTNLSCPIYAEFYLAFGIVGVIIGAVALAYVVRLLEAAKKNENMPQYGICNICIGMAIYCMRGAMLPTTAYMFGLIISFMIAYFIYLIIGTKKSGGHINGK